MDMSGHPKSGTGLANESMRNAPRESLFLLGKLYFTETGAPVDVKVRNLSATGMMVECDVPCSVEQDVHIELKNLGKLPAKIAWIAEKRIGIALLRPIDPNQARPSTSIKHDVPQYLNQKDFRRSGLKLC